jgi:hypothetical protein
MPSTRIGLAWHISATQGKEVVWHNGMTGGYASFVGFTSDGKQGVVVLANTARSVDVVALAALFPQTSMTANTVSLPPKLLASYSGRYELAPGFVLTVAPGAKGLMVQATGQPAFTAQALAEDEFQIAEVGAKLSFMRGKDGEVLSVTLHQHGQDVPGKKLLTN